MRRALVGRAGPLHLVWGARRRRGRRALLAGCRAALPRAARACTRCGLRRR
ncbi:MAG: hypothetical protein KF878_12235 [Planctomycetes bacterium]|nr:hypothetical protein [Planctomycetota bacterium]